MWGGGNIYSSPTTQLDDELSSTSINAVQNKVINEELSYKADLESNNTFSGNNTFTGENTFANGYIVMNNNGLTIKGMQSTILLTDLSGMRLLYHGSELVTKDDFSIDTQALLILICGSNARNATVSPSNWVTEGTTVFCEYPDNSVTTFTKAAVCLLENFTLLKSVCRNGKIIIYYPNTEAPTVELHLAINY